MSRKHTDARRETFCIKYIEGISVPTAAQAAGISERTGWEWMHDQDVQDRITDLVKERNTLAMVQAADVLTELVRIALADPADAFSEDGRMKPLHEIPPALRRTISGIKVTEIWEGKGAERVQKGELKEVKFWDKTRGLEMLARHLALFRDTLILRDGEAIIDEAAIAARTASIIDTIRSRVLREKPVPNVADLRDQLYGGLL